MKRRQVLIVEDDEKIIELVRIHLNDLNLDVHMAMDGPGGLDKIQNGSYDLIILDIMLPVRDGIQLCRDIRQRDKRVPVLMLTARSEELDKVLRLEIGADDYLTKPFSVREFIARVKALLRRGTLSKAPADESGMAEVLDFGNLVIDVDKHQVLRREHQIELTAREFELLLLFARHPGRTYNREQLLDQVWGYNYDGYEHTVNSHINRLRNKLEEDPANPRYIKTLWGVGYRFEVPMEGVTA